jgi:hypothetical protein
MLLERLKEPQAHKIGNIDDPSTLTVFFKWNDHYV